MPLWNELEGTRVADKFPLKQLMRSEGRTAWFATEDASGQPAVISLFESLNDEESVLARMEAAARIRHPNLLIIRETGSIRLEDGPLVYAVMEPFEQTLADVLQERALSREETGEVVGSTLGALQAVHAAGMAHGHVEPASVLAVGDQIKLRSDCLRVPSRDGADGETTDVRGLAATVYEALTQRRAGTGADRDAAKLPAPYASLVRTGLTGNARLADVRRVLEGPSIETAGGAAAAGSAAAGAAASAAAKSARASEAPARAPGHQPDRAPDRAPTRPVQQERSAGEASTRVERAPGVSRAALQYELETGRTFDDGLRKKRRPGVTALALFIMVVLLLFFWWLTARRPARRSLTGHQSAAPAAGSTQPPSDNVPPPPASKPAATAPGRQSHVVKPNEAVSQAMGAPGAAPAAPLAAKPSPTTAAGEDRGVWHVIVYTFNHQDQAQHRAEAMATRHPDLQPQVFTPTGGSPYFVALGSGMSRKDAYLLRNKARAAGLPPDTYIQNYSR
jgi:hypothetical protein